jgi:deoxyribose-phosphate aldolase
LYDLPSVAALIDHTVLRPDATEADVVTICDEALQWRFASVCVNPYWVPLCSERLAGSAVRVCTVIGFPLGANTTAVKLREIEVALEQGARELDMVQNVGALRFGQTAYVQDEIAELAKAAHAGGALLKVIIETALLNDKEKRAACVTSLHAGADFVKTSTGFAKSGANVADVALMRASVGPTLGVKASGGVKTWDALRTMVEAGATRIGTSSGVAILEEMVSSRSARSQGENSAIGDSY